MALGDDRLLPAQLDAGWDIRVHLTENVSMMQAESIKANMAKVFVDESNRPLLDWIHQEERVLFSQIRAADVEKVQSEAQEFFADVSELVEDYEILNWFTAADKPHFVKMWK